MLLRPSTLHSSITRALAIGTCMTIGFAASAQEAEPAEPKGLEKNNRYLTKACRKLK